MDGEVDRTITQSANPHHHELHAITAAERVPKDIPRDTCVICLCPYTERAITYPCNHFFDYLCLVTWLEQRRSCPLCNAAVQRVQYDWRSPTDYKTYAVPNASSSTVRHRSHPSPHIRWSYRRRDRPTAPPTPDAALSRRRLVHARNLFSLHRAPTRPQTQVTPPVFACSPTLQRKARLFLRRELRVFTFLSTPARQEWVVEYVVGMLKRLQIKGADGAMEGLAAEVLGRQGARVLLHDLEAWLGCAFERLEDWDRVVQYDDVEVMRMGRARGQGAGPVVERAKDRSRPS